MLNLLNGVIYGTENFGYGTGYNGNPAIFILGFEIFLYAIIIVLGMTAAIIVGGILLKKRGIDPYDVCTYAIVVIPIGVLGARLYVYIFPWAGQAADWSTFFNFRSGGLGIYGGVILGFLAALVTAKVKKQDFRVVLDCLIVGLFIAQSIGRWGNFANQEAHGPIIENSAFHWFPFGVEIGGNWYYATFFYESMATLAGFIVCLILFKNKKYKLGWLGAFYGIYYGIVRILVEGMRTDSLFLWVGQTQTDIKISQLVSFFTIAFGILTLVKIYRNELDKIYRKFFKTQQQMLDKSRIVLGAVCAICLAIAIFLLVLGGESNFIAAVALFVVSAYSVISIFALTNRMKLICKNCEDCWTEVESPQVENPNAVYFPNKIHKQIVEQNQDGLKAVTFVYLSVLAVVLFVLTLLFLVIGLTGGVPNDIVLAVIFAILCGAIVFEILDKKLYTYFNKQNLSPAKVEIECENGEIFKTTQNLWLLVLVPYKNYQNYGVEHLIEFVEEKPLKTKK